MKERPILFSAPMVRAILDGRKTQTRRIVKPGRTQDWLQLNVLHKSPRAKPVTIDGEQWARFAHPLAGQTVNGIANDEWSPLTCIKHPHGKPGDQLWVRETWRLVGESPEDTLDMFDRDDVQYRADDDQSYIGTYRPSIHMPRWASRITLEITAVRVERLQDISYEDALAEGVADARPLLANGRPPETDETPDEISRRLRWPQREYQILWNAINGPQSWDANPYVWVIEFKRV